MLVLLSLALSFAAAGTLACDWPNHCEGDPCQTWDDCSGDLVCLESKCAPPGQEPTCSWPGHCLGDPCQTLDDCDGNLICTEDKCSPPEHEPPCTWDGHCLGDPCQTEHDCDFDMVCKEGKCAALGESDGIDGDKECTWPGHCLGDICGDENDCDGSLVCVGGKCSPAGGEQTCTWHGHCIGNHCTTENDCSDNLVCKQSTCVDPTATVWPYNIAVSCYTQGGNEYVLVSGDHYNIGSDNVEILIRKEVGGQTVWGPERFDAVKVAGKPGGSFEVKTDLECPVGQADRVRVYAVDMFTGRYRDKSYP